MAKAGAPARSAWARGILTDSQAIRDNTARKIRSRDIRPPIHTLATTSFSGGKQQKLSIAREFEQDPAILLIGMTTRGVVIDAIEFIHKQIISLRDQGKATRQPHPRAISADWWLASPPPATQNRPGRNKWQRRADDRLRLRPYAVLHHELHLHRPCCDRVFMPGSLYPLAALDAGAARPSRAVAAFGAAWTAISAWLQAKRGSPIVITTIMFNCIAASLIKFMLVDVLRPHGHAIPVRRALPGCDRPDSIQPDPRA